MNRGTKSIINSIKNTEVEVKELNEMTSSLILYDDLSKLITKSLNSYGELWMTHQRNYIELKKRSFLVLNKSFDQTINGFINHNKDLLADSISSERNNRKVILLNNNYKNSLKGLFMVNRKVVKPFIFEPESFIKFNNDFQSLNHLILEEEERLLFELSQAVKVEVLSIESNLEVLATLDMILALGKWGYRREAVVAKISNDHSIKLIRVAHPLI